MKVSRSTVLWKNASGTSLEYSTLCCHEHGFAFDGTIIMLLEDLPTKVTYSIKGDCNWHTKQAAILQEQPRKTSQLTLTVDGNRRWYASSAPLPLVESLFDVDLEVSPATNNLSINRLHLAIGQSQETDAVWVRFPSLTIERLKQKYTRLSERCYGYEAPTLGFKAQLEVNPSGLVTRYGELWKQIP